MFRIFSALRAYPAQFRLMFFGMLLSTMGASMIWPFLLIYASQRLQMPMAAVASLLTINSAVNLISSVTAGPLIDRLGRKWMMVASLALNGGYFLLLSHANTYPAFAALMVIGGLVNPIYRIGADAMMADLVEPDRRIEAYSLLRLSTNAGIALGPTVGGFIAASSYDLAFYLAASGMIAYSLLLLFFARETLPDNAATAGIARERFGGYGEILRDRQFMPMVIAFTLVSVCATSIWTLMPIYAKQNYQISERLYGFIPTTNAVMVVTLQMLVTRFTRNYPPLLVMALGAGFYATAAGGVSLAQSFPGFWLCMVWMSIGELIIVPTSSTYVANLAPPDKRGRYMSLYGLSWGTATGIGSFMGGVLNDWVGPKAIWYNAFLLGSLAALSYVLLHYLRKKPSPDQGSLA